MNHSIRKHYSKAITTGFALLLLGLQACVTEEVYLYKDLQESFAVRFSSYNSGIPTRTNSSDNSWVAGDSIGIYMLLEPDNDIANSTADNRLYYATTLDDGQITFVAGEGHQIFYPSTAGAVNFIAYYPYKPTGKRQGDIQNYEYPVDVSKQHNLASIDILYGTSDLPQTASTSPINLQFRHLLTKIIVHISPEAGVVLHNMKAIINGMPTKAQLHLNSGNLTVVDDKKAFDIFGAGRPPAGSTPNDTIFEAIVIPHTVNNSINPSNETIQFFTSEQKQYTWSLPDMELAPRSLYIFKLTFEADAPAAGPLTRSPRIITEMSRQAWTD
ncbi:MAG: fimbrillin family protein [Tannerellaceae bacterium]|nr:fimbrillin family protein [Tannerellaceae bacterium]